MKTSFGALSKYEAYYSNWPKENRMKNRMPFVAAAFLLALVWARPGSAYCRVVVPVAGDDYVTTSKNTPVTFSPLWNDTDTPDQDFWGIDSPPSYGTVQTVYIDSVKYTPNTNYVGSDTFTYILGGCLQCVGSGASAWCSEPDSTTGTVYVTVTN
jgi:hypothetical protein